MKTSFYILVAVALCLLSPTRLLAEEPPADRSDDVAASSAAAVERAAPARSGASQQLEKLDRTTQAILRKSALGLQLGEATGLNLAYDIDKRQQLSALLGFSPVYRSVVSHLDYLYHFYKWVPDGDYGVALSVFAGAGLRLGFFEARPPYLREIPFALGAHVPFGLVVSMPPLPMELVLSAAPGLDISPELRFHAEANMAVRFYLDPTRSQ